MTAALKFEIVKTETLWCFADLGITFRNETNQSNPLENFQQCVLRNQKSYFSCYSNVYFIVTKIISNFCDLFFYVV